MTTSREEILEVERAKGAAQANEIIGNSIKDVIHSERIERLHNIIEGQQKTLCRLTRCFWTMVVLLVVTWSSCVFVLVSGKFPPIEIPITKPDFGSAYPDDYWSK